MPSDPDQKAPAHETTGGARARRSSRATPGGDGRWIRLPPEATIFTLGLVVILVTQFASRPLWHTDLWDHVNYGSHILATGRIPGTEPLLPLAKDVRMVCTAWGAQVAMCYVVSSTRLGLPALQLLYGVLIVLAIGLIGGAVARKTQTAGWGILAYVAFLFVNREQFLIVRPQLVGVTLFALVLVILMMRADRRGTGRWTLPLIFAVWANLHGSFAMGLMLIGTVAVGRFFDALLRTNSLHTALRYRPFRMLLMLISVCFVAAMITPNGWHVYPEIVRVGRHPNIASMYEWDALSFHMKQGKAFAVLATFLILSFIFTPRRRRVAEWLPVVVAAGLTLWSARMINWFAPVASYVACVHGAAIFPRLSLSGLPFTFGQRRLLWTFVCLATIVGGLLFTPFARQTISGRQPNLRTSVSRETPVETANFLAGLQDVPGQLAFYPAEWSGFLTRFGASSNRPMVNLHVHVIPQSVWADYLALIGGSPAYASILDLYRIELVVVDKRRQPQLAARLRQDHAFVLKYEDPQALCFAKRVTETSE